MPAQSIYLVRHAQYDLQDRRDEQEGGLTELGRQQAQLLSLRLANVPVAVIYYGTLRRSAETAAILAEQHPQAVMRGSRLLRECIPALPADDTDRFQAQFTTEQLKSGSEQSKRAFTRFFRPTNPDGQVEILVSSGNLIRYLSLCSIGAPGNLWTRLDINQTGLSEIRILEDGKMQLLSFNDTGHLPLELKTFM